VSRILVIAITLAAALVVPARAYAKVRVAASLSDFASIAATVGGEQVEAFAIARPTADAHRVEALPSYMVRVSRAQIYLRVGLGLDQWADAIIDGSRNDRLKIVDCSQGVRALEVPTGRVNASMGDVHPNGNPHYWLDPRNGAVIARTIAEVLASVDPENAAQYRARADAFGKEAEAAWQRGQEMAAALPAKVVFTYHRSWTYFADAFGLEVAGTVEPVPGIPPTARHLADLVEIARSRHVQLLLNEPYFSDDAARFLAREAGVHAAVVSPSCDAPTAGSYLAHFTAIFQALAQAVGKS